MKSSLFHIHISVCRNLGIILSLSGPFFVDRAAQGTPEVSQWEKERILGLPPPYEFHVFEKTLFLCFIVS